jgi:hypothetical protein
MGEDALRVLKDYLKIFERISSAVAAETVLLSDAVRWASGRKLPQICHKGQ